jgi:hypothetical protein
MVTLKLQLATRPAASVAVHVTDVVPFWNSDPELGVQAAVAPGLGFEVNVITAEHFPASAH